MVDFSSSSGFFSDDFSFLTSISASAAEEIELVMSTPVTSTSDRAYVVGVQEPAGSSDDDEGEDRLIQDFGPRAKEGGGVAPGCGGSSLGPPNYPKMALDRFIEDERGLRRRIVYEPTEVARLLQPRQATTHVMADILETALDQNTPRCESLLLLKAVTDAFLVDRSVGAALDGDFLVQPLRQAWHAVAREHWDGYGSERQAVDLHLAASWFQAWEASDDGTSNLICGGFKAKPSAPAPPCLPDVLPGDWRWLLDSIHEENSNGGRDDNREAEYTLDGLILEEELELEATREQNLRLPREKWALDDLKRSLLLVSNDSWFRKGGGMIDLRVLGPSRPSTFMRVFSNVPGAIYGCLKDLSGVALTPPTFRMYTTGDIVEAFGADVVVRSRDLEGKAAGKVELGEFQTNSDPTSSSGSENITASATRRRQVVSLVEIQVTWVGGYTHVLGWLDSVEA